MKNNKAVIISLTILVVICLSAELLSYIYLSLNQTIVNNEKLAVISVGKSFINRINTYVSKVDVIDIKSFFPKVINQESELESMINDFSENGIGLANTPYSQLINSKIKTITIDDQGELVHRPNTIRYARLIRSRVFNPWDPIIFNSGELNSKNAHVNKFVEECSLRPAIQSTDKDGFRTTLPIVENNEIVLVVGDSVAYGASLSDEETIASQLQRRYKDIRFVNSGVGGSTAKDNRVRLRKNIERFSRDKIVGVIYVHTENDASGNETPETIVKELSKIIDEERVKYKAFVYQVYIYQAMPDLLRGQFYIKFGTKQKLVGRSEKELLHFAKLKKDTLNLAEKEGFHTLDYSKLVDKYIYEKGTPFAGFSLYVDHIHFSVEGTSIVVDFLDNSLQNHLETKSSRNENI